MRLELDGQDVTHIATNVRTEEEIGQRRTMAFDLTYPDGEFFRSSADSFFELAGGGHFLLSDGSRFKLASAGTDPDDFMDVVVSHPDRTFRDAALGLDPWLYWPLDEGRGLASVSDLGAGSRVGTWSPVPGAVLRRQLEADAAAVPYGAAPRFEAGASPGITGPPLTGLGLDVALSLFLRVDSGAAGSSRVVWGRGASQGLGLTRDRIDAETQRISWMVSSDTVNAEIPSGRWVWILALRSGSQISLYLGGVRQAFSAIATAERIDAANTTLDIADGAALDSEVDEVAVWDRIPTGSLSCRR